MIARLREIAGKDHASNNRALARLLL